MNDCCPSVVLEAMACSVPVVHPASGGTTELVGEEGGIGVPHEASWTRLVPPSAAELAGAVSLVLADHDRFREAARKRVVEHYALEPWLDRHDALFAELLAQPK
jgi:glycosyltransferase involved in cell wall biosynthesis